MTTIRSILGLAPGTLFSHGIVVDNSVEIYRLVVGEGAVAASEPGTLMILVAG